MNIDYHRTVTLFVIGNGFDLHHSLPTSYGDFKEYLKGVNEDLVDDLDSILSEKGFDPNDIEKWSKLEQFLAEFPNMDFEQLEEDAFDGAEQDMDRAGYWSDPGYIAKTESRKICELLTSVKSNLKGWIDSICIDKVQRDKSLNFPNDAYFLNFNYTKTLECVYDIPEDRILHIHNDKDEYVLGHNQEKEIPYPNEENLIQGEDGNLVSDDPDSRFADVRRSLNGAYLSVYNEYYKNTCELLCKNANWLKCVSDAREIVFMGLSMGNEDLPYLDFISRKARNCSVIKAYYHTLQDLESMSVILECKFPKAKIDFLKW